MSDFDVLDLSTYFIRLARLNDMEAVNSCVSYIFKRYGKTQLDRFRINHACILAKLMVLRESLQE